MLWYTQHKLCLFGFPCQHFGGVKRKHGWPEKGEQMKRCEEMYIAFDGGPAGLTVLCYVLSAPKILLYHLKVSISVATVMRQTPDHGGKCRRKLLTRCQVASVIVNGNQDLAVAYSQTKCETARFWRLHSPLISISSFLPPSTNYSPVTHVSLD